MKKIVISLALLIFSQFCRSMDAIYDLGNSPEHIKEIIPLVHVSANLYHPSEFSEFIDGDIASQQNMFIVVVLDVKSRLPHRLLWIDLKVDFEYNNGVTVTRIFEHIPFYASKKGKHFDILKLDFKEADSSISIKEISVTSVSAK